MKKSIVSFIQVKGKNYEYKFSSDATEPEMVFFECKGGNFAQFYPRSEIANLLEDLPALILETQSIKKEKANDRIVFRVSTAERKKIERKATERGFTSLSSFLRETALQA